MKTVADLMIPLNEYTVVSDQASLLDAIQALEKAQAARSDNPSRPTDRAVLVRDAGGAIVGKLSMWDLLRGLEPGYDRPVDPLSMVESFGLWSHSMLRNLRGKAQQLKVDGLLRASGDDERIAIEAPLDQAVGQLVEGRFLSLLAMRGDEIVGILRLSDVFCQVGAMMREARTPTAPA